LPVLIKVKDAYLLWYTYYQDIPKLHRHSLGYRIESLFVEIIEAIAAASFLGPTEKHPHVRLSIRRLDALKILMMILWETKSLIDKRYIALSIKLDEIGKNLGGWSGQIARQNVPVTKQNSPKSPSRG